MKSVDHNNAGIYIYIQEELSLLCTFLITLFPRASKHTATCIMFHWQM